MKILFLDCETTGDDEKDHSIVQLSGIYLDGDKKENINWNIAPRNDRTYQEEALAIIGKTMDELSDYDTNRVAFVEFRDWLNEKVDRFDRQDKIQIIGYRVSFDEKFLRQFFIDNGDNFYGSYFWNPGIDVMNLAANKLILERPLLSNFKLSTVCKHFGIPVDETRLHDSIYDIELTMALYEEIMK